MWLTIGQVLAWRGVEGEIASMDDSIADHGICRLFFLAPRPTYDPKAVVEPFIPTPLQTGVLNSEKPIILELGTLGQFLVFAYLLLFYPLLSL